MIRLLITGSKGQLGLELANLKNHFTNYQFFFADKSDLDISNFEAVSNFISSKKIEVIINCAAYTNVDKAEDEPSLANKINYLAVKNLAEIAKKNSLKLIHISTDYVFEGTSSIPYSEGDVTKPQNIYGSSKLKGEQAIIEINPSNSIIIRTSWLYSTFGHNFVKTILKLSSEKDQISVVSDQIGSPTNASNLANTILKIIPSIKNKHVEVYHYTNKGQCSWFQFAEEIVNRSNRLCKVEPICSEKFNSKAKRPKYSLLNTTKIQKTFQLEIPTWEDALKECLKKI